MAAEDVQSALMHESAAASQETLTLDELGRPAQVDLAGGNSEVRRGVVGLPRDGVGLSELPDGAGGWGEDRRVPDVALFNLNGGSKSGGGSEDKRGEGGRELHDED
jgi:hypothetical protein